jgi:hypothetical protein
MLETNLYDFGISKQYKLGGVPEEISGNFLYLYLDGG